MSEEQVPPSGALISVAQVDHGISMYLGIFKTIAQAAGKGMKVTAQKAGELKTAVFSTAGRITNNMTAAMKAPPGKTEKPVTPRQELHKSLGAEIKQAHSMEPMQKEKLERVTERLRANNISHINIGAHEALAHQFSQATAVSAELSTSQERGR